jgi:hypothetical protein
MAEGSETYMGLAVPLFGESEIQQQTLGNDILSLTGAASQTGDFLVCQSSAGAEKFVVDKDGDLVLAGKIDTMVLGTIAIGTLASNASTTVALTGITTGHIVNVFSRASSTVPLPVVWAAGANSLGVGAPSVALAAVTLNYWMFTTA